MREGAILFRCNKFAHYAGSAGVQLTRSVTQIAHGTSRYCLLQFFSPKRTVQLQARHISIRADRLHYFWSTISPQDAQLAYADRFFESSDPQFLFSTANFRDLPDSSVPEVAFLGRSNVGKSSLLNALFNRTRVRLAHVSKRPGRTRTMNAYGIGGTGGGTRSPGSSADRHADERWIGLGGLVIMDMPGYGHGSRQEWGPQILAYLQRRKQLRRAFLLIDAEHGVKRTDEQTLRILRQNGVPHQVVLTKADKVVRKGSMATDALDEDLEALRQTAVEVRAALHEAGDSTALGEILCCSSRLAQSPTKKLGIDGLRWAILQAAGLESDAQGQRTRRIEVPVDDGA